MRKSTKKVDIIIIAVIILLIAGVVLLAVLPKQEQQEDSGISAAREVTVSDYNGKRIGVLTGTNYDAVTQEYFPDSECFYYSGYSDLNAALLEGKIDGFLGDEPVLRSIHNEQPEIDYVKDKVTDNQYSFAFRKNDEAEARLCAQMNEFLAKLRNNGTLEDMELIWYGNDESKKTVDMSGLDGKNGTIHVITTSTDAPFSYIKGGKNVGYDIDVVVRFCREYGYALDLGDADFSARIPAIESGKYDFTTAMNVTEERKEQVLFSDKVSGGGIALAVRTSDIDGTKQSVKPDQSFLDSIISSFEKNFIREDRWKLILDGIGTTCFITVMSALFGSILAFLVCMFRRTGSRLANAISNIYVKLLQGTPIVVLLMILYYVVLGKSGLEAVWVAVIGFTLNFGAYTAEIMHSGIESIDGGQREAALALGYNENQAFFRFIFPQAVVRFLPVYRGEIVSLLKSTSIVGYIAIQDLTKMSDIIRSRTYEAFFPLIATAIIYFILAWIISLILKLILNAIDKRHRRAS